MSTKLFASVSRLFEAPTTFELEDDVRGNNERWTPCTAPSCEVGMRGYDSGGEARWHWDVAVYYAQIHDEILSVDDPRRRATA